MGPFPHDAPPATISADNPAGTDGFEFVEFAHPEPEKLEALFERMGYTPVARPRRTGAVRHARAPAVALAQWQSTGMWIQRLRVRAPQATPTLLRRGGCAAGCARSVRVLPMPAGSGRRLPRRLTEPVCACHRLVRCPSMTPAAVRPVASSAGPYPCSTTTDASSGW